MKFLIENELEKRHKKHKKTIKPGAMGSFIHPDGGNQVAIDTFNNSVDMGSVSSTGLGEALNESYDSKFKDIINYIKSILPKDTHFSYDDYRVIPDDMGSGMRFQVEFDSKDSSLQDKVINSIERKFYGVTADKGWGRDWDYYITIKVDDRACNESLKEDKEILYIIKDRQGNQLSRPNLDDNELWDRVDSMDPYGKKGYRVVAYTGESLTEDTVKQNGKWVNKGKEGTHGKFNTKKQADAQRRAMFANGYRESLDNGFSNREDLQYEIKRYNQLAPRYDKLSIIDELMNNGYTYEEAEYIANNTTNLNEDWNIIDQIDAPETIGKLKPGDKFKNRNGVVITIIDPTKDGTIQFKIQSKNYPYEVRCGKEKSIQQMLYRNNYMRIEDWK